MSARLLATFCLGIFFVSVSSAQSAGSADSELVVYLKTGTNQPNAPITQMKQDLAALMRTAGYQVSFRTPRTGAGDDASYLAVVQLNGTCALPAGYIGILGPPVNGESLATTNITDGQVLPFSTVNCEALTRSVAPALRTSVAAQRDFLYGRALARVVAHELYHILAGSIDHAKSGVARSCFSQDDLVAERFNFELTTLARMKRPDPAVTGISLGEEATDR